MPNNLSVEQYLLVFKTPDNEAQNTSQGCSIPTKQAHSYFFLQFK